MNKLSAMAVALIIIILSVKITLNFKPLYYYDIKELNIITNTSLNENEIKSAYDYLIKYVNSNQKEDFKIPNLPSSKEGSIHFKEVKNIFIKLNYILYVSLFVFILGLLYSYKKRNYDFLRLGSILTIIFPIALAIPFGINFNKSFNTFHQIFFSNDYWIFDPKLDPVINILPEEFFFHCAIVILLLIALGSILLRLVYSILKKKITFPS